jgi:2-polyprenyl-3-methyl-5-hydroxy-6-metoxy-1,4-benzoquinol methylase
MSDMEVASNIISADTGEIFGSSYSSWKGWEFDSFGQMSGRDRATYDRELRAVRKIMSEEIRCVLEIGFGQGSFLAYCREQGWQATGTEASEPLVKAAEQAGFPVSLASDAVKLPDAAFDLIAGFDVIEHIPQSEMLPFLALLRQKLKPGGTIFLRFPNADSWLGNQNFNGDPTHVTAMGHFKLEYFCQRAGLEIVSFGPEARLGFDGGLAKGIHGLIAGPIISILGWITKAIYFPRSRMVLTSANVVACLQPVKSEGHGVG